MELWALTSRLLRTTLRSPTARAAWVIFGLGVGAAIWLGTREAHAAGVLLLAGLILLTFVVTGAAVGAGSVLPEDRVAGREEWLSTLAPAGWQRRLAAVLAGWLLAVGLGGLGGVLVGAVTGVLRPDVELRSHRPLALPADTVSRDATDPVVIAVPGAAPGWDVVEVDVRPRFEFYRLGLPASRIRIRWRAGAAGGEREISARGSVRFDVPASAAQLELTSLTPHVHLRALSARRLGRTQSPVRALGWAGLLLGILAGAAAPLAVLFSRQTTGQTAAAAAFSLLLLGAARAPILELAAQLQPEGWMRFAPAVLHTLAWVAPDVGIFGVFEQVVARRVPQALPSAALLYTAAATVLACLPAPRALREGANA